jgi:hexosaminidase
LPAGGPASFTLKGALAAQGGVHDLCLVFTSPVTGPLYGIGSATLVPVTEARR